MLLAQSPHVTDCAAPQASAAGAGASGSATATGRLCRRADEQPHLYARFLKPGDCYRKGGGRKTSSFLESLLVPRVCPSC